MNKVIAGQITGKQYRMRGLIADYTVNAANSFALALLVCIALRIINLKISKGFT